MATQKDQRLYGKFTLNFPRHPKIAILSDAAFRCLVEATLYSRDELSDGLLARRYAIARWGADVLAELCENDDEKPSLVEVEKGWLIHDYAEHQDTRAEVEARSERNKAAGKKGGLAKASRAAKQVASATLSESLPETESETVSKREPANAGSTRARRPQRPQPNFGEQLRGEPDPPQEPPPHDPTTRPVAATETRRKAERLVTAALKGEHHPSSVLSELRNQTSALLIEGWNEEIVSAALVLWRTKAVHPKTLPALVSEVIASRRPISAQGSTAYERKTAHNAEIFDRLSAAAGESNGSAMKELTR